MSAIFRIAHVSDLHFGGIADRLSPLDSPEGAFSKARIAFSHLLKSRNLDETIYPSTFDSEVALNLLLDLNDHAPQCDAVLVTGDLATTGSDADLLIARDYFFGRLASEWVPTKAALPSLIGDAACATFTLPGNHDRYEGRALRPGNLSFERFFGNNWDFGAGVIHDTESVFAQSPAKYGLLLKPDNRHGLLVCFADLSLDYGDQRGAFDWIGQGSVNTPQLMALIDTTRKVRLELEDANVDFGIIWAVHFPPCFSGIDPALELIGGQRLIDAAAQHGATLILAGHTHADRCYRSESGVWVSCGGASAGRTAHNQYSYTFLDIEISGGIRNVTRSLMEWNAEEGIFDLQGVHTLF
jgi:3',5'-cyclic AMP phosphodiesterase CpdA